MAKPGTILAIDQGTTSSRAIVFGADLRVRGSAQREFAQHYPASGWVEHDPEDIWRTTVETARQALAAAKLGAGDIAAIGITNQRETCVIWDRRTGKPIHRAIVWQDRRTADAVPQPEGAGHEPMVTAKTGLLLDPYFSATKIAWLLDNVEGARALAKAGHLAFGTIDTLPDLAAHRRQGARHRRHQRLAHAALRHRQGRLGRRSAAPVRCAARDAARGARLQCRLRRDRAVDPRRRDAHPRRRRRPAGGHHRPGLLPARHGEGDLRHRLLRAAQHRRRAGRLAATGC